MSSSPAATNACTTAHHILDFQKFQKAACCKDGRKNRDNPDEDHRTKIKIFLKFESRDYTQVFISLLNKHLSVLKNLDLNLPCKATPAWDVEIRLPQSHLHNKKRRCLIPFLACFDNIWPGLAHWMHLSTIFPAALLTAHKGWRISTYVLDGRLAV